MRTRTIQRKSLLTLTLGWLQLFLSLGCADAESSMPGVEEESWDNIRMSQIGRAHV